MKQALLPILFAFMLTNCAFQKEKNTDTKNLEQKSGTINEPDQAVPLADHLRRVAGVSVKRNDQNATVTIRGIAPILQTALSAKSSSTFANPVTVFPFASSSPLDSFA